VTRHVKILWKRSFDGNVETYGATTLAKAIYDTINGKTLISMAATETGLHSKIILIFDD
jgi:hypothetical protein